MEVIALVFHKFKDNEGGLKDIPNPNVLICIVIGRFAFLDFE
jgi:hypothetical protein